MGLFDLPGPVFGLIDQAMALLLPPLARLVAWGLLAGVASMLLYRLISPQGKIAAAKAAAIAARRRLNAYQGDFAGARPLMAAQLRTAFRHLGLVLAPSVLSSLPALCLLVWLDNTYAYDFPAPGELPPVEVQPDAAFEGQFRSDDSGGRVQIRARPDGQTLADVPLEAPVPLLEKWSWLNLLFGNPAGYLPDSAPVERVSITLPEKYYLDFGPDWARSWLALFLPVLVVTSLAMYRIARID